MAVTLQDGSTREWRCAESVGHAHHVVQTDNGGNLNGDRCGVKDLGVLGHNDRLSAAVKHEHHCSPTRYKLQGLVGHIKEQHTPHTSNLSPCTLAQRPFRCGHDVGRRRTLTRGSKGSRHAKAPVVRSRQREKGRLAPPLSLPKSPGCSHDRHDGQWVGREIGDETARGPTGDGHRRKRPRGFHLRPDGVSLERPPTVRSCLAARPISRTCRST
jgi:hypothetical protein